MADQREFTGENRVRGEFGRQLGEQLARAFRLMLALAGESQPRFRGGVFS
jgi:hypothetical protein